MMLKKALFIFTLTLFLASCDEEKTEPLSIETVSAVIQDDGSVLLTGKIVSEGSSGISELGFGIGENPEPDENEIIIKNAITQGNLFSLVATDFDENTKYYFRAFAKAAGIVTTGKIIMLENIKAKPVVAPCTPVLNTVDYGQGTGNFANIGASTSPMGWEISTSAKGIFYKIRFENKPSTGIYTTVSDFVPAGKGVYILLGDGLSDYPVEPGAKVYVNKIDANKWDITLCQAPFTMLLKMKLSFRIQVTD